MTTQEINAKFGETTKVILRTENGVSRAERYTKTFDSVDLTQKENYFFEVETIKKAFLSRLGKTIKLAPNAAIRISPEYFNLHIIDETGRSVFASDIEFMLPREFLNESSEIRFGSAGAFGLENKGSYWKTIHAAGILENFEKVTADFSEYMKLLKELRTKAARQTEEKKNREARAALIAEGEQWEAEENERDEY